MAFSCRECKLEVASRDALVAHWQEQQDLEKRHYHCSLCMELFRNPEAEHRHRKELHAAKQSLDCPGCSERFVAAHGLIAHIENNRCKRIKNDDYVACREEKLAFSRELQRRHHGDDPNLPGDVLVASLSVAGTTRAGQGPYSFTPFLSIAKDASRALHRRAQWQQRKRDCLSLEPGHFLLPRDAPPALRPSRETQQALQRPAQPNETVWPPHDPRNPRWNPAEYFVPYIMKYKCPHDRCARSFPSVAGIRGHLLSARHARLARVQCPRCCKWFDSMAAITPHAESQGVRCNLRETNGYRQFLDQLTAGLVDTTEKNDDDTEKYKVPDEARERFGTEQGRWAM
ncbi:hypothetical protein N658DRAFT_465540 [Parathielavia hyrcaniae]|uniref:C2H2-type domain-containing protein n=1 Tax=Parathielavia hyrcaniae TaxID=113614 RepID=A0AAN6Q5B5_9PEZI|nr:hypothetical protein N658DRAFT_465540 [Parathielavia hyrcaniae]